MEPKRTVYYTDPLNDDFAHTNIHAKDVGADFPFIHKSVLWNVLAQCVYYCIAVPIVFVISKIYLGLKYENRQVLRKLRGTGYFLYGNHTRMLDAFLPAMTAFPKKAYVVSNPDAVSLPFLQTLVTMLGVIPIPTKFSGMRQFLSSVNQRYQEGNVLAIFPEAHIWPFYTGIRPFSATSFRYPEKLNAPVVAMVTTYRKRRGLFRLFHRPGMTVTLSEPFYPDAALSPREAQQKLRDQVYDFMVSVSQSHENVEYIAYEPVPEAEMGSDSL